jgi:uncharacterized protein YggU (UPF0235/DUF167 family)
MDGRVSKICMEVEFMEGLLSRKKQVEYPQVREEYTLAWPINRLTLL